MSKTKATLDFSSYSGPTFAPVGQTIHDQMTANAVMFPAPPVTMGVLQTLVSNFDVALAAKASRAKADIIAFNIARHEMEVALADLGGYVNLIAQGDPVFVVASGFPSYETGHTPDTAPPAAPTDVVLRHGDLSGTIVARYHPSRPKSINQVQINSADPNVEAGWVDAGMFSGGKANIGSLTPGWTLWVRVRTVGLKAVMGAWSDPAKIFVI